ncbi:NAD-dependent epimerase/dehydratase family protein [Pseudarthrobacter sp. H2]|uniref:NAD-dependent epimerase/dehydratase family protein n=1 Tax=Pseudarthrobacter sp. H2 TaxID=3418415 RepID=UPI003CFB3EDF
MTAQRVLVVGGTGLIGAHAALLLSERGDSVAVASRSGVKDNPQLAAFEHLRGDYTAGTFTESDLASFDSIVFAAGNDVRHVAVTDESDRFWSSVQSDGVPNFVATAKRAGVGRVVQVGSCYHQFDPSFAGGSPYVESRRLADERSRALSDGGFAVITLNPPPIVGSIPGRVQRRFGRMVQWVRGQMPEVPVFAPRGGTNYMSARSLAQAIGGALTAGEPGRAYLVGDENLSYAEYFGMLAEVAGRTDPLEVRDEEHPFQPDRFIVQGRGNTMSYEPEPVEVERLGYDRGDIRRALTEIVTAIDADASTNRRG